MKIDGFLLSMLLAVALALAFPSLGTAGPLPLDLITQGGIALLFLLHGAGLSPAALRAGVTNWRLHLFVQGSTFVAFPALGLALMFLPSGLPAEARFGLFFLCALPSTISSSVAMVALARGNVPGAIFNATLSGLIGMVATPLLVGLVSSARGAGLPLGPAMADIALTLLLPFVIGQLLRPLLAAPIARWKRWVTLLDRGVIVLIVFESFSHSTAQGLWSRFAPLTLAMIAVAVAVLLAVALLATTLAARTLGFSREDEITAVFCGSKKSLANGAPIAKALFGTSATLGAVLLPLLLYHQLQLLVCAALARRYAARADPKP